MNYRIWGLLLLIFTLAFAYFVPSVFSPERLVRMDVILQTEAEISEIIIDAILTFTGIAGVVMMLWPWKENKWN